MLDGSLQPRKLEGHEGDDRWWTGCLATIKLTSAQTAGRFSLVETVLPPQVPVPAHLHTEQDELFYVLAGELTFRIDGREMRAPEGTTVFVPRGTPHAFATSSSAPARYLFLHTPGGLDEFVRATSEPAPTHTVPPPGPPPTAEQIAGFVELMGRHGMQPA